MTKRSVLVAVTLVAVLGLVGVSIMNAQQPAQPVSDKPLIEKWAPTEWGPDDKAGAVNRTTPALVLKALKLVKLSRSWPVKGPTGFCKAWRMAALRPASGITTTPVGCGLRSIGLSLKLIQ